MNHFAHFDTYFEIALFA